MPRRPGRAITNSVIFAVGAVTSRAPARRSAGRGSSDGTRNPARRCCDAGSAMMPPRGTTCGCGSTPRSTPSGAPGCCPRRSRSHSRDTVSMRRTGTARELEDSAEKFDSPGFRAWARHARGAVLVEQDRAAEALPVLQDALRRYRDTGCRYEMAQVHEWMAQAYQATGDGAAPHPTLPAPTPSSGSSAPSRAARSTCELPGGLTKREAEVLGCIAAGCVQPRGRQTVVHQRQDGRPASGQHLRQARSLLAYGGGGLGAREPCAARRLRRLHLLHHRCPAQTHDSRDEGDAVRAITSTP